MRRTEVTFSFSTEPEIQLVLPDERGWGPKPKLFGKRCRKQDSLTRHLKGKNRHHWMRRGCNLRQLQPSGQHGWSRLPQPSSHPLGYCIAVVHLSSQLANIDTSLTQVHSSHQGSLSVIQPVSSNEFTAARIHHYNVTWNSFAALRIPRVPFIHVSIISLFFRMPYIRII